MRQLLADVEGEKGTQGGTLHASRKHFSNTHNHWSSIVFNAMHTIIS